MQSYLGKFETRYGIQVVFDRSHRPLPRLGAAMEMTVLRIAQEALLNIARHSQANHVNLSVNCEDNTIVLTIQDNGIGIPSLEEDNRLSGHGLVIMRERAEAVGGTLQITSLPGKGTQIEAILPITNSGRNNAGDEE